MAETIIAWTDYTFNPWLGCSKVSPGCANCYAESAFDKRRHVAKWGANGTRIVTSESYWKKPLRWNRDAQCNCGAAGLGGIECSFCQGGAKMPKVFCASLSDVFEDWSGEMLCAGGYAHYTSDSDCRRVATGQISGFLMNDYHCTSMDDCRQRLFYLIDETPNLDWQLLTKRPENIRRMWLGQGRENVWIGTSVEDMRVAGRVDHLRDIPAVVRFISYEPALGPLDDLDLTGIDWVIQGGESGSGFRGMPIEWARSMKEKCEAAGVAYFFKQSAAYRTEMGIELDGRIVRNFPVPRSV